MTSGRSATSGAELYAPNKGEGTEAAGGEQERLGTNFAHLARRPDDLGQKPPASGGTTALCRGS